MRDGERLARKSEALKNINKADHAEPPGFGKVLDRAAMGLEAELAQGRDIGLSVSRQASR